MRAGLYPPNSLNFFNEDYADRMIFRLRLSSDFLPAGSG